MREDILVDIIDQCLAIEQKARSIYAKLSDSADGDELKMFWKKVSHEEGEHIQYWHKLKKLTEEGMIPQVFDDPFKIKDELKTINDEVDALMKQKKVLTDIHLAFVLTYRLEFYLLHPAFAALFHLLKIFTPEKTPEDYYDSHISKIIVFINKVKTTPELHLIGDTIQRLWDLNRSLANQGMTDFLTGVLNRRGLFNAIKPLSFLAQRNNYNVGILMIDIDKFKKINDTYGHQKGDHVIKSIAKIIRSQIRASDVVGRYGGDEFLIFLSSVKQDFLHRTAEKILISVKKKPISNIPVTISIGAAQGLIKSDPEKEMTSLIGKADEYLYQAKYSGRNRVVVSVE